MPKLPSRANLEQLKKQAKARQAQTGTALSVAQFELAREYGFPSWTRLKSFTLSRALQRQKPALLLQTLLTLSEADLGAQYAKMPLHEILAVRGLALDQQVFSVLVDGLLRGCQHTSARVRFDCATALDHMADERCTPVLRTLLHDPVPRVRRAALHSLSCDACKVTALHNRQDLVSELIEIAQTDTNTRVRLAAIFALTENCTDARVKPVLQAALELPLDSIFAKILTRALKQLEALGQIAS